MSLGSPVPWQWVFLNAPVEAADIWEMPLVIQVTAVIAITIFFLVRHSTNPLKAPIPNKAEHSMTT